MSNDTQPGRLIAVVGPSGVGKDSVIAGLCDKRPGLVLARRAITRPHDAGGEDHQALTPAAFRDRLAAGDFLLAWDAHGLHYGLPRGVLEDLAAGRDVVANLSRGVLAQARARVARLTVLSLTATPRTLADRLGARARETPGQIAARLARVRPAFPPGIELVELANDGPLDETVEAALRGLFPEHPGKPRP